MTADNVRLDQERRAVEEWIRAEREICFEGCAYGRFLRRSFHSPAIPPSLVRAASEDIERLPAGVREFRKLFLDGVNLTDGNIPGYHGLLNRSLKLVQLADKLTTGTSNEKVALTTLPTNQRYAAIYEPVVAPGWSVIALDWGMVSAMVGLSVTSAAALALSKRKLASKTCLRMPKRP